MLPTDNAERKALPVFTFLTEYFMLAFLEVVRVAVAGDKQHGNTGEKIRWAREKSTDQLNTALRHMMDYGAGKKRDTDGRAHLAKAIWRLSAQLQLDEEADIEKAKPAVVVGGGWPCYYCAYPDREPAPTCCPVPNNHLPRYQFQSWEEHVDHLCGIPEVMIGAGGVSKLMYDETGVPWGAASPLVYPPNFCTDCGADLGETGHFVTCLSRANPANR